MSFRDRKEELLYMKRMLEDQIESYKANQTMPSSYLEEHIEDSMQKLERVDSELNQMEALAGCTLVNERYVQTYVYEDQRDADRAMLYFRQAGYIACYQRDEETGKGELKIVRERLIMESSDGSRKNDSI